MTTPREGAGEFVTHRMLSARRIKINELRNKVEELNQQLIEVERENKILKRQNAIREKQIDRHESEDSEVRT